MANPECNNIDALIKLICSPDTSGEDDSFTDMLLSNKSKTNGNDCHNELLWSHKKKHSEPEKFCRNSVNTFNRGDCQLNGLNREQNVEISRFVHTNIPTGDVKRKCLFQKVQQSPKVMHDVNAQDSHDHGHGYLDEHYQLTKSHTFVEAANTNKEHPSKFNRESGQDPKKSDEEIKSKKKHSSTITNPQNHNIDALIKLFCSPDSSDEDDSIIDMLLSSKTKTDCHKELSSSPKRKHLEPKHFSRSFQRNSINTVRHFNPLVGSSGEQKVKKSRLTDTKIPTEDVRRKCLFHKVENYSKANNTQNLSPELRGPSRQSFKFHGSSVQRKDSYVPAAIKTVKSTKTQQTRKKSATNTAATFEEVLAMIINKDDTSPNVTEEELFRHSKTTDVESKLL